jgi:cell division protein FtsZ
MSEMGTAVMGAGKACGDDRAMMAVKEAIGSPLLDDINLMGARGVLVNITAGMNLTMKEFDEVGSQVADLASDNATVVVGTVIDPDIGDELRVTVVATGLGDEVPRAHKPVPLEVVGTGTHGPADAVPVEPAETSTPSRSSSESSKSQPQTDDMFSTEGIDYLDIPSFLRVQAD